VQTTTGQPRYPRSRAAFAATSASRPSLPRKELSGWKPCAPGGTASGHAPPAQDGGAASPTASKPMSDPCCQTRRTGRLSPVGSHNNASPDSSALAMRQTWAPPGERSSSTQSRIASSVTMCAGLNIRQRVWRRASPRRPASCSAPVTWFRLPSWCPGRRSARNHCAQPLVIASRLRLENEIRSPRPTVAASQRTLVCGFTDGAEAAEALGDDAVELACSGVPVHDRLVHQGPEPLASWSSVGRTVGDSPCENPLQAAPRYAATGRRIEPRSARTSAAGRGRPKR
jgi:hypothetical protein